MILTSLHLRNFRNIAEQTISPGPGVNLVLGRNGQGKTNLVEAISFLSWLKSFRTARTADLVRAGEEAAWLEARIEGTSGARALEATVGRGFRKVSLDGRGVRSARECMAALQVATLSPDDPAVLEGGPDGRRLLLDRFAVLLDPGRAAVLDRHARLLKERNRILRDEPGTWDAAVLDATEEALAAAAADVARLRLDSVARLAAAVPAILADMAGADLKPHLAYGSRWLAPGADPGEAAEALRARFAASRVADAAVGYTTAGPQADDLDVSLQDLKARGHASRGQKKVLMLAVKAAEAAECARTHGEEPVMVLDDALADLDPERQERVVARLCARPGQTFVTSAVDVPGAWRNARVFRAAAGTFVREEN